MFHLYHNIANTRYNVVVPILLIGVSLLSDETGSSFLTKVLLMQGGIKILPLQLFLGMNRTESDANQINTRSVIY